MSLDRLDSERQRWVPVVNTTSENIPPYAAMEVIGCVLPGDTTYPNEIGAFKVRKPASDDLISNVLFADASGIGSNGAGIGTLHFPAIVHYEYPGSVAGSSSGASGSTSVETGTTLGTKADSWYLAVDGFGFASIGTGTEYGDGDRGYTSANLSTAPPAGTTIREIQGLCVTRCSDDTQGSGSTPGVPTGMVLLGNTTWCISRTLSLVPPGIAGGGTTYCTGTQVLTYDDALQKWVAPADGTCPEFHMRWNPTETRFEWSYDAGATWVEDEGSYSGSFSSGNFTIVFYEPPGGGDVWQWGGPGDPSCTESGGGDPIGSAPVPGPSGDPGCNAITDIRVKVRDKDVRTGLYVGESYCLQSLDCGDNADDYCAGSEVTGETVSVTSCGTTFTAPKRWNWRYIRACGELASTPNLFYENHPVLMHWTLLSPFSQSIVAGQIELPSDANYTNVWATEQFGNGSRTYGVIMMICNNGSDFTVKLYSSPTTIAAAANIVKEITVTNVQTLLRFEFSNPNTGGENLTPCFTGDFSGLIEVDPV